MQRRVKLRGVVGREERRRREGGQLGRLREEPEEERGKKTLEQIQHRRVELGD